MFGPTYEQLESVDKQRAIATAALLNILLEKGICTVEDFNRAVISQTAVVDQIWEQRKQEQRAEFDADHPGVRELFGKVLGMEQ